MNARQYNRGTRGPGGRAGRRPPTQGRGSVISCPMVIPVLPFVIVWVLARLIAGRLLTGGRTS